MELAPLVTLGLSIGLSGLSRAELAEVLCCPWGDMGKEFHFHTAKGLAWGIGVSKSMQDYLVEIRPTPQGNVKKDHWICGCGFSHA